MVSFINCPIGVPNTGFTLQVLRKYWTLKAGMIYALAQKSMHIMCRALALR